MYLRFIISNAISESNEEENNNYTSNVTRENIH